MSKEFTAHYFNRTEAGRFHTVTHHLQKCQFLEGICFGKVVLSLQFLPNLPKTLRNVETCVTLTRTNALDQVGQSLFEHFSDMQESVDEFNDLPRQGVRVGGQTAEATAAPLISFVGGAVVLTRRLYVFPDTTPLIHDARVIGFPTQNKKLQTITQR